MYSLLSILVFSDVFLEKFNAKNILFWSICNCQRYKLAYSGIDTVMVVMNILPFFMGEGYDRNWNLVGI